MLMTPTSRNECEYKIMWNKLSIGSVIVTVLAHSRSQQVVILSLPTHSYRHTPPSCLRHCHYGKKKNFLTRLSNRLTWRSDVHLENRRPLIWLFIEILLIFWGLGWWINYSQKPVLKMMPLKKKKKERKRCQCMIKCSMALNENAEIRTMKWVFINPF